MCCPCFVLVAVGLRRLQLLGVVAAGVVDVVAQLVRQLGDPPGARQQRIVVPREASLVSGLGFDATCLGQV